jgi:hypothetical protein
MLWRLRTNQVRRLCVAHCHPYSYLLDQHGLCRAISYIIQSLSAERTFGNKLAAPIKVQLPPKATVVGNAGDFLINVSIGSWQLSLDSYGYFRPSMQ